MTTLKSHTLAQADLSPKRHIECGSATVGRLTRSRKFRIARTAAPDPRDIGLEHGRHPHSSLSTATSLKYGMNLPPILLGCSMVTATGIGEGRLDR